MWTWIPVFLAQVLHVSRLNAPVVAFWVIAVGAFVVRGYAPRTTRFLLKER